MPIHFTKYVNEETLTRHVSTFGLRPSGANYVGMVLEYVSQTLYALFSLGQKLVVVFSPSTKLRSPKRKAFCTGRTFTVFQHEKFCAAAMLVSCMHIDLRFSGW